MATRVSYEKAIRKMRALGNVLHKPLRDVLDTGARVCAVRCAYGTAPFGSGADAKAQGEKAVVRDIRRIYATPGDAYEDISQNDDRAAKGFWKAIKSGDIDSAQQILDSKGSRLRGVPIGEFDESLHRGARSRTRPVIRESRRLQIVLNSRPLTRYIERVKGNVGFAKGGWADVTRALGKTPRGLRDEGDITANWITRKGHGFGKAFRKGTDEHPSIEIRNDVPFADQALSESGLNEARRIARELMIENLRYAVQAETRALKNAA